MARYRFIAFFLGIILLFGCAQIGTITGGERDLSAPKPTDDLTPPNASTFFDTRSIVMPFDEYFTLNDPRNTITIVPPHATLETRMKGKNLYISFEDTLQENTTYAIYFNKAIKDLSEGNDSVMQYVFSTGSTIDSLSYTVPVVDASTNLPLDDIIVALYDTVERELVNFTQTTSAGLAELRYLSARSYSLLAFKDANGDLEYQPNERVGFQNDSIFSLDSSVVSLEPIRVFSPLKEPKITSLIYSSPGSFFLGANRPISDAQLFWDDTLLRKDQFRIIAPDSLQLFFNEAKLRSGSLVVKTAEFSDTMSYRVLDGQKKGKITLKPANSSFGPQDTIAFEMNSMITSVDTSRIRFITKEDSTRVPIQALSIEKNTLFAIVDHPKIIQNILVEFDSMAVQTMNGGNLQTKTSISLLPERKFGSLNLNVSYYSSPIIVEMLQGKSVIRTFVISDPSIPILVEWLTPGGYTFRVTMDDNQNGVWDTGNLLLRTQPEVVADYSTPTKVRGNWSVDVELVPRSTTDEEPPE